MWSLHTYTSSKGCRKVEKISQGKVQLFEDLWQAVVNDEYMWLVVWGPPRTAKTTIAGWMLHSLYKDWEKVLAAFGYNLTDIIYKMRHGIPERWPTRNGLHMRVPGLNWDDFGAHSNKAVTQYDEGWDHFKGGFDVLGTQIGVLIATMVDPMEPTFQLTSKYTHEIEVTERGVYKYDRVKWLQDYKGWRPRIKKYHIETNTFDPWPEEVYKEYDETRTSLADEVFQRIEDAQAQGQTTWILKLCQPIDFDLLNMIRNRGPIQHANAMELGKGAKQCLVRLKARHLIVSTHMGGGYYKYDITPLGYDILHAHENPEPQQSQPQILAAQKTQ